MFSPSIQYNRIYVVDRNKQDVRIKTQGSKNKTPNKTFRCAKTFTKNDACICITFAHCENDEFGAFSTRRRWVQPR
jgi:hypothetical protein